MIKLAKTVTAVNKRDFFRSMAVLLLTAAVMIFSGSAISMNAAAQAIEKVCDRAGVLTGSEKRELENKLSEASRSSGQDIIVFTVNGLDGHTAERRAEIAADEAGAGSSGILYLVAINDREYDIYVFGEMDNIMSDSRRERLAEELRPYLSKGDYYGAFTRFGERAAEIAGGSGSLHLSVTFSPGIVLGSAIISLIIVLVMKAGMKTTRPEITAGNYVRRGSFSLTRSRDVFLYSSVSRRKIESSSSGGHHSGGHRSGGSHSSGKF